MFENLTRYIADKKNKLEEVKKFIESESNNKSIMENRIQPLTRLRKSVEEIKNANENPEIQKIYDRISDVMKGGN